MTTTKATWTAAALLSAVPFAARADRLPEEVAAPPAVLHRGYYGPAYPPGYYQRPQARQGLLLSFGVGGGSLYLSNEGPGRIGAADVDFRIGYGFNDRFQMFMDFNTDQGHDWYGDAVGSWTWTLRAQTLLAGDRAGNGLNVNFGAGFGGLTYDSPNVDRAAGPTGFALAGGVSYDARIAPNFSLSPEFFFTWHQVPNLPGIPDDVSSIYGVRLNLLWYLH